MGQIFKIQRCYNIYRNIIDIYIDVDVIFYRKVICKKPGIKNL